MLITDNVVFIHVPKTAGMSVTRYLIDILPGEKILTVPSGHATVEDGLTIKRGSRHENLTDAALVLEELGRSIWDIPLVLAVIRNPYDLEASRFFYYRIGHPWDAGPLQDLAMEGDFDRFCREALYPYIRRPVPIERYYSLDGDVPLPNMRLIRFENLSADLNDALSPFVTTSAVLPHENATLRPPWRELVNERNEPYIYEKYQWLFRYYDRWVAPR